MGAGLVRVGGVVWGRGTCVGGQFTRGVGVCIGWCALSTWGGVCVEWCTVGVGVRVWGGVNWLVYMGRGGRGVYLGGGAMWEGEVG